ncbi:DUF2975 domain-containing protein [Allonocardiopsis opalescens]|uniref:DUF2975 family protein n=1 Tax=Allonocardiopsis opalescens TaxID=1144618 RepID=A0A2T0Q7A6_9ACTN|nr:DUF2975 domain-containing protein [Allonocardiopsis opalescens]PRX99716.1 Protein of unknown function (DUF2975) [Allonocardiopsis opalescens]
MHLYFTIILRAGVAFAVLMGLFGQFVVIPGTAAGEVERFPPYAPLEVPYVTLAVIGVACVQVALIAVWQLLGMVGRDAIFTSRAFLWVDVIIGATVVATLLTGGVTVHLFFADIPSPADGMDLLSAFLAAAMTTGGGVALTMLLVLMRGLLRKATDLQTEISEVV